MWDLRPYKSGCLLRLRVRPNASKNGVDGCLEGVLRLKLSATPTGGEANEACIRYLSDLLDFPKSRIALFRGARSRDKVVWFKDTDPAALVERLNTLLK